MNKETKTRNLLLTAAIIWAVTVFSSHAADLYRFDLPKELIGRTYGTDIILKKDGSLLGRAITKFEKRYYKGKEFLVITGRSGGTVDKKPFASEVSRTFLMDAGKIVPYSIKGTTKTGGKIWTDYFLGFDREGMTARVTYKDFEKNEAADKTVALDANMIAIQDLDLYFSSLPGRNISEERLKALLPNGQTFWFLIKMSPQPETVTVKGENIVCRRIELKPDLGLLNIIIPNVNYWVRNKPPYDLVRYSGLLSGPGSPDVIMETVRSE